MPESAIEKKCRLLVEELGGRLPKWKSPGNSGVQDRILLLWPPALYIEFKNGPKAPVRPKQIEWRNWMRDHGFEVHICCSYEEFVDILWSHPSGIPNRCLPVLLRERRQLALRQGRQR